MAVNELLHVESKGDYTLEKRVIYEIPGMREITRRSVIYASDNAVPLTMDIYYPHNLPATSQLPVVIFVFGFPILWSLNDLA